MMDEWTIKLYWLVECYRLELAKRYWVTMWLDVDLWWSSICWIHETVLISKNFWFIQWLIENDKIDFEKDKYWMIFYEDWVQKFIESEEEILMELSIQDNPIKFLISILK